MYVNFIYTVKWVWFTLVVLAHLVQSNWTRLHIASQTLFVLLSCLVYCPFQHIRGHIGIVHACISDRVFVHSNAASLKYHIEGTTLLTYARSQSLKWMNLYIICLALDKEATTITLKVFIRLCTYGDLYTVIHIKQTSLQTKLIN